MGSKIDIFSRFLSVVAIVVSGASAYYSWSQSPFFYACNLDLTYSCVYCSTLTEQGTPDKSSLLVQVMNETDRPAKNVSVLVRTLACDLEDGSSTVSIRCSRNATISDALEGRSNILIHTIPAKSGAMITVDEQDFARYPEARFYIGSKHRYTPEVESVETDFGSIPHYHDADASKIQFLPNDAFSIMN